MKETLELLGWVCVECNCKGRNGVDCINKNFRNVIIKTYPNADRFRLYLNGFLIEVGNGYEIKEKLKEQNLITN